MRAIARRFGFGSLVALGLTIVHLRKPKLHALQAAILGLTLVIVWLGLELVVG
jgi:hypothetical protein